MVVQELGPENTDVDLVHYGALPPEAVHRAWKAMELVKKGAYILPNYEPGNNPMSTSAWRSSSAATGEGQAKY